MKITKIFIFFCNRIFQYSILRLLSFKEVKNQTEFFLSQMILDCQCPVNILYADTKELDGRTYGQMMIELPAGERETEKIIAWLKNSQIDWQEEA